MTVWIDTKTNLPVKGLILPQGEDEPRGIKLEETWEKIELDVEIPDSKFKLEDEKKEEKKDDDK